MKHLLMSLVAVVGVSGLVLGAEFHVSVTGNDAHDGTAAKPFATVGRAVSALRALRVSAPQEPVRVVIGAGTFELAAPIALTDKETTGPVAFVGAGAEKTILSGGRRIDGWRIGSDGRSWSVTLPEVSNGTWRVEQAYVGDRRVLRPALPRDNYFSSVTEVPANLRQDLANGTELVVIRGATLTRSRVQALNPDDLREAYFRLENVKSAYGDVEGEWFCDARMGVLSYLPRPDETPASAPFVVPVLRNLVSVQGDRRTGRKAAHVSFSAIGFAHVAEPLADPTREAGTAIRIDFADHVTIDACAVRHTGGWGVKIEGGCTDCAVTGSTFFDLGAGGVALRDTHACRVERCLVEGGGRVRADAAGICGTQSGGTTIAHNTIRDFYASGIRVDAASGTRVEWNHVYDLGQRVLSEVGGIHTRGRQSGTILRCNLIHDIRTARSGAQGIYLDAGSVGILVCSNIVTRADEAAFSIASDAGDGNRIENNVFLFPRRYMAWTFPEAAKGPSVTVAHNIFVWDDKLMGLFPAGGPASSWHFSSNVWWSAAWPEKIHFRQPGGTNTFSLVEAPKGSRWKVWQKLAVPSADVAAWLASAPGDTVEDPRLGAPYGNEMHLMPWPDSPAIARGFVPFDLAAGVGHEPKEKPYARQRAQVFATRTFPAAPLITGRLPTSPADTTQSQSLSIQASAPSLVMTVFNQRYILGGAGMGVVFRTPGGKTIFFDMGNGSSDVVAHNCGRDTIDPWLYAHDIRRIDGIVISHAHGDHFGGLLDLWHKYPVDKFWDNAYQMPGTRAGEDVAGEVGAVARLRAQLKSANPHLICRGVRQFEKLDWEPGLDVTVITPPKEGIPYLPNPNRMKRDGPEHHLINANALGIRVEYGEVSYQIVGDIQEDYEAAFLLPKLPERFRSCDILMPCSHGIHATDAEAAYFHPKVAVGTVFADGAPDGWCRSWAYSLAIWRPYTAAGAATYVSGVDGDVTVSSDGQTWRVTTEFGANRRVDPFRPPTTTLAR